MTAALKDIATQVPSLKKEIQDGLLQVLSLVLMGRPLRHPGAPKQPAVASPPSGKLKELEVALTSGYLKWPAVALTPG